MKWITNPPCKAHTILSKMFDEGKFRPDIQAKL